MDKELERLLDADVNDPVNNYQNLPACEPVNLPQNLPLSDPVNSPQKPILPPEQLTQPVVRPVEYKPTDPSTPVRRKMETPYSPVNLPVNSPSPSRKVNDNPRRNPERDRKPPSYLQEYIT